jgi:hypothetical protein
MKRIFKVLAVSTVLALVAVTAFAAAAKATTVTVVGLYSETSDGYISYRVGTGNWTVVKVKDVIPADAEIKINVDRDWIEVTPTDKPNTVYEITGPDSGEKILKVTDILKGKSRTVNFPKATGDKPDAKYKDKLVVAQYLGRQIYIKADGSQKDIKYGDVLEKTAKVSIIAINNTIDLMNDGGKVTTVIGPLKFEIEKVLTNQQLYKFLNVQK